jgi:hypothetical protein
MHPTSGAAVSTLRWGRFGVRDGMAVRRLANSVTLCDDREVSYAVRQRANPDGHPTIRKPTRPTTMRESASTGHGWLR